MRSIALHQTLDESRRLRRGAEAKRWFGASVVPTWSLPGALAELTLDVASLASFVERERRWSTTLRKALFVHSGCPIDGPCVSSTSSLDC
jgi:hypothetical protein